MSMSGLYMEMKKVEKEAYEKELKKGRGEEEARAAAAKASEESMHAVLGGTFRLAGGALGGAALGTAILPGVGTVIGGVVGGLCGSIKGCKDKTYKDNLVSAGNAISGWFRIFK